MHIYLFPSLQLVMSTEISYERTYAEPVFKAPASRKKRPMSAKKRKQVRKRNNAQKRAASKVKNMFSPKAAAKAAISFFSPPPKAKTVLFANDPIYDDYPPIGESLTGLTAMSTESFEEDFADILNDIATEAELQTGAEDAEPEILMEKKSSDPLDICFNVFSFLRR